MSQVEERLAQHGLTVPEVSAPVATYIPAVRTGNLVYTSGQLPFANGELLATGIVGSDVDEVTAAAAAQQSALNAIAAIKSVIVDLDKVVRIVKVVGFVASAPSFTKQPVVINGASELFAKAFGDAGVHARSAVGVSALPLNAAVEVEVIVEVRD
jgi:enamine deaminase RidA (YjgF/YER057c/UK114 family)